MHWYLSYSPGDQDLAKFLKDEIATEKQNSRPLPKLSGWDVKADGSEVCEIEILTLMICGWSKSIFKKTYSIAALAGDTDQKIWLWRGDGHLECESHSGQRCSRWWHRRGERNQLQGCSCSIVCFRLLRCFQSPTLKLTWSSLVARPFLSHAAMSRRKIILRGRNRMRKVSRRNAPTEEKIQP